MRLALPQLSLTGSEPRQPLWRRSPEHDFMITLDAWKHRDTGEVRWVPLGVDMNTATAEQVLVIDNA